MPPRTSLMLILMVAAAACGGDTDLRSGEAVASDDPSSAATTPSAERTDELLCDVIDEDEALTPAGAEPIDMVGVEEANSERRCMLAFGVDMTTEEIRSFYRSTLADRGFEIDQFIEGDGIARGNVSRTLIRATKPGLRVSMTVDGFNPDETSMAEYEIQAKLQFDAADG